MEKTTERVSNPRLTKGQARVLSWIYDNQPLIEDVVLAYVHENTTGLDRLKAMGLATRSPSGIYYVTAYGKAVVLLRRKMRARYLQENDRSPYKDI